MVLSLSLSLNTEIWPGALQKHPLRVTSRTARDENAVRGVVRAFPGWSQIAKALRHDFQIATNHLILVAIHDVVATNPINHAGSDPQVYENALSFRQAVVPFYTP